MYQLLDLHEISHLAISIDETSSHHLPGLPHQKSIVRSQPHHITRSVAQETIIDFLHCSAHIALPSRSVIGF